MQRYRAFGMNIASDVRMDELAPADDTSAAPDLTIMRTQVGYEIKPLGEAPPSFHWDDPRGVTMIWPGAAAIRIVNTSLIEVEPYPDIPETYLPFPILGPIMGWLLHMRDTYVLHASAVHINGRSVAFMGDKLAGKSTTAASFLRAGASLITDDLLAFDIPAEGSPLMQPAFGQLKLSEEAGANIKVPGAQPLPLVMDGFEKKQYRLSSMISQALPCDAIFVLERGGSEPEITWMDGATALSALLRYSYLVRFSTAPVAMQNRQRHFEQAALLARRVSIGRLRIPADLDRMQEAVDYVTQTVEARSA